MLFNLCIASTGQTGTQDIQSLQESASIKKMGSARMIDSVGHSSKQALHLVQFLSM